MLFFSTVVSKFNKGYSFLSGEEVEEDDEEGERQREKDGDRQSNSSNQSNFNSKWGFIALIDNVSETLRISWAEAFQLNVYEFFNIVAYIIDKRKNEEKLINDWKRKH